MEQFAKRIRSFRLRRDLTQERLAELLGVTAQAVSKWETGASCPDISLLPALSAALGVTLDELFATSDETHLERIEQMIEDGAALSEEDFRYAEKRLREYCAKGALRGRCLTMLAELYIGRAEHYRNLAGDCAKQALEIDPEKKANHDALFRAMNGPMLDWCATNHIALIDYYRGFVALHPGFAAGYMWYMDALIADRRLDEARQALTKMRAARDDFRCELYESLIARAAGDRAEEERCLERMVEKYPDEWMAWFERGDAHAHHAEYEKALADYRAAAGRQKEKPRIADLYDSIAQICTLLGDRDGAIEAYEQVLAILRDDWQLTEGETVDGYLENIRQLRA
ncbi:MAG: helix-turn-helix domain-containing protein [Ruminococcaceae bacterium]|nr:helix-turn-helix domain-containing protein [Oscillospiraceae bacterium]